MDYGLLLYSAASVLSTVCLVRRVLRRPTVGIDEPTSCKSARPLFLLDPKVSHLNHGSFGSCPKGILRHRMQVLNRIEAYPDRFFRQEAVHEYKQACDIAGTLIRAEQGSCVLVENATQAMDAIASSVTVPAGSSVIVFESTYGAVKRCAAALCEKSSATLVQVSIAFGSNGANGHTFLAPLEAALQREASERRSVSLVVLDHVTSPTGIVTPLIEMAQMCRKYGVKRIAVDGAHAPGLLAVEARQLDEAGIHYYWGNLHKWCFVPRGVALLRAAPGAPRKELRNPTVSHFAKERLQWQFFMCGTNDQSKFLSVPFALKFVEEKFGGLQAVARRGKALAQQGAEALLARFKEREPQRTFIYIAPAPMCVSMATVQTPLDARYFLHPSRRRELEMEMGRSLSGAGAGAGEGASRGGAWRVAPDSKVDKVVATDPMVAERIARLIQKRFRIQTVVFPLEGRLWCRLSAQVYNTIDEYEALAGAIVALCDECDSGRDPLIEGLEESDWGFGQVDQDTGAMCGGCDGPERRESVTGLLQ